jgi:hypothetical protein
MCDCCCALKAGGHVCHWMNVKVRPSYSVGVMRSTDFFVLGPPRCAPVQLMWGSTDMRCWIKRTAAGTRLGALQLQTPSVIYVLWTFCSLSFYCFCYSITLSLYILYLCSVFLFPFFCPILFLFNFCPLKCLYFCTSVLVYFFLFSSVLPCFVPFFLSLFLRHLLLLASLYFCFFTELLAIHFSLCNNSSLLPFFCTFIFCAIMHISFCFFCNWALMSK